jgi:hypothetical protein
MLLTYTLALLFGCGLVFAAYIIYGLSKFPSKIGSVGAAGAALAALSLWQIVAIILRFPRLKISDDRITLRWLAGSSWAAWTSLGPFHTEPRPFGMNFQNDLISAEIIGPEASSDARKAAKLSIPMRNFAPSSRTLCAELNTYREHALGNPAGTPPIQPLPATSAAGTTAWRG